MATLPIQAQQLIEMAKGAPRALKIIAAVAALDIIILLFAAFSLEDDVDARIDHIAELRGQLSSQRKKIDSTRKEIDRLPELRRSYDAAINSGVLADQDRLKLVSLAQDLANQHRMIDLHYRLAPEEVAQLTGSKYRIVSTPVVLTNGAVLDSDVFSFWDEILDKSPAHYQVTKFLIERNAGDFKTTIAGMGPKHPVSLVKAELDFRWISLRPPPEMVKAADAGATPPAAAPTPAAAASTPVAAASAAQPVAGASR